MPTGRRRPGPNYDYRVGGRALTAFSVARNQCVLWRTPLPNTGEGWPPVVAGGCVFLTCHKPMSADEQPGRAIYAMCFDAASGKELWRREPPATRSIDMASGFSDNTAASLSRTASTSASSMSAAQFVPLIWMDN